VRGTSLTFHLFLHFQPRYALPLSGEVATAIGGSLSIGELVAFTLSQFAPAGLLYIRQYHHIALPIDGPKQLRFEDYLTPLLRSKTSRMLFCHPPRAALS